MKRFQAAAFSAIFLCASQCAAQMLDRLDFSITAPEGRVFQALATDAEGAVYVASGDQRGYGFGPGVFADGYDSSDGLVTKYSRDGEELLSIRIDANEPNDLRSVAIGPTGEIYVGGGTIGDLGGNFTTSADGFVRKYSSTGEELWTLQFGSSYTVVENIAVDANGDVIMAGTTYGNIDTSSRSSGGDVFLIKVSSEKVTHWVEQIDLPGGEQLGDLALAPDGTAYLTGLSSAGPAIEAFFAKVSPDGEAVLSTIFSTNDTTEEPPYGIGIAVGVNDDGVAYAGGRVSRDADPLLSRFAADGTQLPGITSERPFNYADIRAVAVDANGDALLGGFFTNAEPSRCPLTAHFCSIPPPTFEAILVRVTADGSFEPSGVDLGLLADESIERVHALSFDSRGGLYVTDGFTLLRVSAVPEPSSLAMVFAAAVFTARRRR